MFVLYVCFAFVIDFDVCSVFIVFVYYVVLNDCCLCFMLFLFCTPTIHITKSAARHGRSFRLKSVGVPPPPPPPPLSWAPSGHGEVAFWKFWKFFWKKNVQKIPKHFKKVGKRAPGRSLWQREEEEEEEEEEDLRPSPCWPHD